MANTIPYVIPVGKDKPKVLTLVPSDPGSRYKTRQLQVQVVGKSKMIKTVLVNILDVAKDMQVPPSYIGTFMGYDIGAQAKFDSKKPERQQAHISGEHDTKDLSKIMEKFITEVVLCPVCGLPEILLSFEGKKVMGKCRACGGHSEMPINNEKFKNYVMKNPPSTGAKGEKEAFKGNTTAAAKKETDKKKEPKKTSKKEKKENESDSEGSDDDGVVWFTDTSEEAAKKRREEMIPKALEEKTMETEIEEFSKALKQLAAPQALDRLKQLKTEQDLKNEDFLNRLFTAIFGNTTDLQTEVKAHQLVLKHYLKEEEAQLQLLKYLDNLCGNVNTNLVPKIALVLKDLYDNDMLEEEHILSWYQAGVTPLVTEKAKPLVQWLQEAEEEDSDDDEEEEDDD